MRPGGVLPTGPSQLALSLTGKNSRVARPYIASPAQLMDTLPVVLVLIQGKRAMPEQEESLRGGRSYGEEYMHLSIQSKTMLEWRV